MSSPRFSRACLGCVGRDRCNSSLLLSFLLSFVVVVIVVVVVVTRRSRALAPSVPTACTTHLIFASLARDIVRRLTRDARHAFLTFVRASPASARRSYFS